MLLVEVTTLSAYTTVPKNYLDSENLLPEVLKVVKRGLGGDRVDEYEALAVLHVQVSHRGKLFLKKISSNKCHNIPHTCKYRSRYFFQQNHSLIDSPHCLNILINFVCKQSVEVKNYASGIISSAKKLQ